MVASQVSNSHTSEARQPGHCRCEVWRDARRSGQKHSRHTRAAPDKQAKRQMIAVKQLPELIRRMRELLEKFQVDKVGAQERMIVGLVDNEYPSKTEERRPHDRMPLKFNALLLWRTRKLLAASRTAYLNDGVAINGVSGWSCISSGRTRACNNRSRVCIPRQQGDWRGTTRFYLVRDVKQFQEGF